MTIGKRRIRPRAATRIALRPHDPSTGEVMKKEEVVKGYEYEPGQFVTFMAEELKALDVESSKVIDLEKFVPRCDIDPFYFDSPYHLYPDGPIAVETLRVIGAAIAEGGGCRDRAAHAQPARADGDGRAARHRNGAAHITRRKRGSGIAVRQR